MTAVASIKDILALESSGRPDTWPDNTYDLLLKGAAIDPEAPALSFFLTADDHARLETWTYRRFIEDITRTANGLHSLGIASDDVIALMLPNLPETHFLLWGGEATGVVLAINPLLEPAAIADLLNAAGASVLVTLAPFANVDLWEKARAAAPSVASLQHLILVNLADRVRGPKRLAARVLQWRKSRKACSGRGPASDLPARIRVHDFRRLIAKQRGDALVSDRRIKGDDIASFFCTGGTTGVPKIAMRRHRAETANAWSISCVMGRGVGPGKVVFCGLPLFHVNGVMVTGLAPFSQGAHVVLGTPQGFRGEGVISRFWEIVERHRINFFSGVPTLYAALLNTPVAGRRIDCLEYGLCGAAPMPVQLFNEFQDRTGLRVLEGYGLTEATCVSSVNPPGGERRVGSIGLRLPGQMMKVVQLDADHRYLRDCAVDETGVLAISGANLFDGYRLAEQNADLWIDMGDGRRWLNTGDLGRQDADGYFWLTGRKKELIIRGGHNIDPAVIEEPLSRHPAVLMAAAVGRPDPHAGELPVAYVQLRPGAKATEDELLHFARAEIAERAAAPKAVHIVDALPLTAVGKVLKPALRRRELRQAALQLLADADLPTRHLEVFDDPGRGLLLKAAAADPAEAKQIARALGRLPFPQDVRILA